MSILNNVLLGAAVLAASTLVAFKCHGAEITVGPRNHYEDGFVMVNGEIIEGDEHRFAVTMHKAANPGHELIIVLDTPGGDWNEATKMAMWIRDYRRKGWRVVTAVEGVCASSCLTLLAMGEFHAIVEGSIVAVHTIVSGETEATAVEDPVTSLKWARWLRDAGMPETIVAKLLTTSSRAATPVSYDELKAWGFKVIPNLTN